MRCSACGAANPEEARFCAACGVKLAPPTTCPGCGAPVRPEHRFCNACGTPLVAAAREAAPTAAPRPPDDAGAHGSGAAAVSRKVVTIVFADLAGSTALHERLDAESVRGFMDAYYQAMRGAVEAHGGTVTQLLGDGVKAVFGAPRVAEDDAIRAVRAAVAMQEGFAELAQQQAGAVGRVGLRVAVNTGEVIASDNAEIIGDPVNVAARLQEQARDGDVVIGEATRRLVSEVVTLAPLGTFALKGRSESVAAYRVVSLERPAGASATPFVGRDDELRRLLAVYEDAVADRRARLAVVLGSPGLGKSRVLGELARRLGDAATVLSAHCDAAGGATFAPIADTLRVFLRIEDGAAPDTVRAALDAVVGEEAEAGRIASGVAALLAGAPAASEEMFFAVRRFLGALAGSRPMVLAIDDLQWAEPLLLDLTEHLVQWSTDVPLFVLVAARPELREARSSLAVPGALVAEVVTLAGLDALAAMKLAANAIGADELPAAVAGRVLATSEGNPLFVGELVRMLVQDGTLVREGNRWKIGVELAGLEMPPTIQALLAARIERLRPEERTVLERAAVVGRQFSRAAVKELLPREIADLDRVLEALRRSELVEPDTGWFLGEPALRFHHALIRDAAYRRLLKNTRADLHARFADWVVGRVGEATPHDETIGWHLEQAHQHLGELGPIDAQGRALGERASRHLAAAGRRALARDDVPLAASLLGRALDRLELADPARGELALDWCEALLAAGEVGAAGRAIDELGRFTSGSARLSAWHTCFAGERAALTDPKALRSTADAVAAAAEELTAAGDAAGEAKAHFVHAIALARLGKVGACEAALDRALAAARRARDRRRANAVLSGAPLAALWGPSPVTRASGRCLDVVRVLRITQGSPAVEAVALRCQGVLEALRGRSEAARRMIASSRRMVEELGITQRLLQADQFAGQVELIEGDPAAAERSLRTAYDGMRELGLGSDAAQCAAQLARALLAQDRAAEAEALSHESEALAGDDLHSAIAWRGVRAEALARRGEAAAAVELARAAVEIASGTDALLFHADARLALAAALRAAGRAGEAAAEEARATSLWEAKGATLLAERARREGARAAIPPPVAPTQAAQPVRRRIRANTAIAYLNRSEAAIAAGDLNALRRLNTDSLRLTHHPTGVDLDRDEISEWFRLYSTDEIASHHAVPVASLGDSLALVRRSTTASASIGAEFGAFEHATVDLIEVDAQGRAERIELFDHDRLGDAIARLYERYAEQRPAGPERERAAAIARSVAASTQVAFDPDRTAYAPDVEVVDHRVLSTHSAQGAAAVRQHLRAWLDIATDLTTRIDDVLALQPDAHLLRRTFSGIDRESGGAFERTFLLLHVFSSDGLITRPEYFDADRESDALARFDELTREPVRPARRVRANAATETLECEAQGADHRFEALVTLGDRLALARRSVVGANQIEDLILTEADVDRRQPRTEIFGREHLGDAVKRLYERYAQLLTDRVERDRAGAIARGIAALIDTYDPGRWTRAVSPAIEFIDHRLVGLPSAHGSEKFLRALRVFYETGGEMNTATEDALELRAESLVLRSTTRGTDPTTGGAYEQAQITLFVFGSDGLLSRLEVFEPEREGDALARFDALTAESARARRVPPNAASAHVARSTAAIRARDLDAVAMTLSEDTRTIEHTTGATYDRAAQLATIRLLLQARDLTYHQEPIATLGDALVLSRVALSASGFSGPRFDVGAYAHDQWVLAEIDADERGSRSEVFACDRLGDAVARLYERHAELLPEGPARDRAAATARSVAGFILRFESDRFADALSPHVEFTDHRRLVGLGSARGKDRIVRGFQIARDLVVDEQLRVDDVLALVPNGIVVRTTNSGIDRTTGGSFERTFVRLGIFGRDGLVSHSEWFDADREADALARFDALTTEPPRPARRVRPNAATANARRVEAAVAARDADAFEQLIGDDATELHHPTGSEFDRPQMLRSWRTFLSAEDFALAYEPLATLGDALALIRSSASASGVARRNVDVGAYERETINLIEVDAEGKRRRTEFFDTRSLGDAIARLYERYAELLPEASARGRASVVARTVALFMGRDPRRCGEGFAPDIAHADYRELIGSAMPAGRYGSERLRQGIATWYEAVDDAVQTVEEILELRPNALVIRRSERGRVRATGGTYELPFLVALLFGADGLVARTEMFDAGREAEALARFDELMHEPARAARIENAATRSAARYVRAWEARDWEGVVATLSPDFRMSDRRALMQLELDREPFLAFTRQGFELGSSRVFGVLLATRGDRLALLRGGFEGTGGSTSIGPSEIHVLTLIEVGADGRRVAQVRFDPDDLDAAYEELLTRYAAGEATEHPLIAAAQYRYARALSARDWEKLTSQFSRDFVMEDHRVLGMGTMHSGEEWVASQRSLLELRPDARLWLDHVVVNGRASFVIGRWLGAERDGKFEIPFIAVQAVAADGRFDRWEIYDVEQLDIARARFAALAAPPAPTRLIENTATRSLDRFVRAWAERDWNAVRTSYAPGFRSSDRRSLVRLDFDLDQHLEFQRPLFEMKSSRVVAEVLATRGDRLALTRVRTEVADDSVGPSEIPSLLVHEVDRDGQWLYIARFDADALDAAYAELDARYAAGEAARHPAMWAVVSGMGRAIRSRDWDRLTSYFSAFVREDHRLLGAGRTNSIETYVAALRSLIDLRPDAFVRRKHLMLADRAALAVTSWLGRESEGEFEIPYVLVFEAGPDGRICREDAYDLDQLDAARARFAELAAPAPRDPLAALLKPNAATAAMDRMLEHFEARDWDAIRALSGSELLYADRRSHVQISGGVDAWLADWRLAADSGFRYERRFVGTSGDRIDLERELWTRGSADDGVEVEMLRLTAVDERGKIVASISFDPDDWPGVVREGMSRLDAAEAATAEAFREFAEGFNDHDRTRMCAAFAPNIRVNDRHRAGIGAVEGADAYVDSIEALWHLSPDVRSESLGFRIEPHGVLTAGRSFGTGLAGGPFERLMINVCIVAGGRITHLELFDLDDIDAALARFEELRPDPLQIPPNAATRFLSRFNRALGSADWETAGALLAPELVFDDRRRSALVTGDRDMYLASLRFMGKAQVDTTVLATAGDRLALVHQIHMEARERPSWDAEGLAVIELDPQGRLVAAVVFDPDDRRSASLEMLERSRSWLPKGGYEFLRGFADRDLARCRAALPDDFVCDDHRRTGIGRIEGADAYVASLAAIFDQTREAGFELLHVIARSDHVALSVARGHGKLRDGGEFESVYLHISHVGGGRFREVEFFELEDIDRARARFEELCRSATP